MGDQTERTAYVHGHHERKVLRIIAVMRATLHGVGVICVVLIGFARRALPTSVVIIRSVPRLIIWSLRNLIHMTGRVIAVIMATMTIVALFAFELVGALTTICALTPKLYHSYKNFNPKGLKNKARTVVRISRRVYTHKLRPVFMRLGSRLAKLYPFATPQAARRMLALPVTQRTIRGAAVFAIVAIALINILLPALQARADSLTWSTNADFAMNKSGKCQAATFTNLQMSGGDYMDNTCGTTGVDASLKLMSSGTNLANVKSVAGGASHSLVLKNDGTVWAWGGNSYGQLGDGTNTQRGLPAQVKDSIGTGYLTGIIAISSGDNHSVALKNDGTVWAWGYNNVGQLGAGNTSNQSLPVQVKDASGAGYLTGISAIAAGGPYATALRNDGTVWAWGEGYASLLGNNQGGNRSLPVQVKDASGAGYLTGITALSAGGFGIISYYHTLALKNDGTVWAWGYNNYGQIGDGTTSNRTLPVQVKDSTGTGYLTGITAIAAGDYHSVALKNDGSVWAWGANGNGQLGDKTTANRSLPVQVMDTSGSSYFAGGTAISASTLRTIVTRNDNSVWAWGRNTNGELGDGTTAQTNLPVQVKDSAGTGYLKSIIGVAGGQAHSLALMDDGTVWAWGQNTYGQAGVAEVPTRTPNRLLPGRVLMSYTANPLMNVQSIAAGGNFSLVLKNDGTVWAWGQNTYGQLGDNSTFNRTTPVQVKNGDGSGYLTGIVAIAAGYNHALALKNDGTVWAWGAGDYGQLGEGVSLQRSLPVQVKNSAGTGYLTGVTAISAASGTYWNWLPNGVSYALINDGTVWAWGANGSGQLGDGTTTQRNLPVEVKDSAGTGYLSGVTSIDAGEFFCLALKGDGSVVAWGGNGHGQLGDGTTTQRNLPTAVRDSSGTGYLSGIVAIAGNGGTGSQNYSYPNGNSLALKNDGTVWSWGTGSWGQLGDGSTTDRSLPGQVKDASGSGYLTGITAISLGYYHAMALRNDGTVWSWGGGEAGQMGDGTGSWGNNLPKQAKDPSGSGFLTNVSRVSGGFLHAVVLKNDGSVLSWGRNTEYQLGNWSSVSALLPTQTFSSVQFTGGFLASGTAAGYVVDSGTKRRSKWQSISWSTDALPINTTIKFSVRTSDDAATWSNWSEYVQSTLGSTSHTADTVALPATRYLEIKVTLAATGDMVTTPTLNDFSLQLSTDVTPPLTNAGAVRMFASNGGVEESPGGWNTSSSPYFSWAPAQDDANGVGIGGYCLYIGQDSFADVAQTKGSYLGNSPLDSSGLCQYAVADPNINLSTPGILTAAIPSSTQPYYLLIKAFDRSNNLYAGNPALFSFLNDVTPPKNIGYVSLPSQFIPTKDVTITWPTSGGQTATDSTSGLAGIQYRIGNTGTWYGLAHNGAQDITDVIPVGNGNYKTDPTYDYPLLSDGNNMIYFRSIDLAGNISATQTSAVIKINTASPSSPQSVTATPTANTQNSFAFTWQQPATFVGQASNLTYCYTVNTLPTDNTCTYTSPGQTGLSSGSYATQPGDNTFYVVAKDEAGNINYATAASVLFTANTSAPGIPLNTEIADVSVKATQSWKLALSWEAPTVTGAGVANYRVYRSSVNATSGFMQVATTSGNSYVDTKLDAQTYYYKVKACDSANNCGAETAVVSKLPTGRFTVAAEITGAPSVVAGSRKATITWYTARDSDSKVQIGIKSGVYQAAETSVSVQTKMHQIDLTNLEAGTTYYYKAKWTDEDGNTGTTTELMFTTLPAPTVSSVKVVKTNLTSATLQVTTKDAIRIAVNYGKTNGFGGVKLLNTSKNESTYNIELEGLDDGAMYYFRPDLLDADNYTYTGDTYNFTTPARPRITNLRFQPVAGEPTSTQRVTWQTNVPASSIVTYGLAGTSGTDLLDSKLVTDHSVTIKDLKDDSNYFLLAQSRDAESNLAVGDKQTFRTALDTRPPKITDVNVETTVKGTGTDARGQIVVTWKTDEPTTSQVAYGQGGGKNGSYTNSTVDDTRLQTEHTVVISDLRTSSVYYLQPISSDSANNQTKADEQSAIIGRPTDNVMTIILNALYRTFGL